MNKNFEQARKKLGLIKRCPECGHILKQHAIYIPKGKNNKFGYNGIIICDNDNCLYEKFYKIPMANRKPCPKYRNIGGNEKWHNQQ